VRVGVIGVGYFGRFHAAKYAALPGCALTAVVDIAPARARAAALHFGSRAFCDLDAALAEVDAVSVATPTASHYQVAAACLARGVHVLLEKPMTRSLAEAAALIDLAERQGCVLQIGHQERFFAARLDLARHCPKPAAIVCERLGPFTGRSVDCSVVTDLMIHDIDFVQSLVAAPLTAVQARGRGCRSARADSAEVHLTYADGTEVTLHASRIHDGRRRTARLVDGGDADVAIEVDFLARRGTHSRTGPLPASEPLGGAAVAPDDNLGQELAAFLATVRSGGRPMVTAQDGYRALETALTIEGYLGAPLQAAANL